MSYLVFLFSFLFSYSDSCNMEKLDQLAIPGASDITGFYQDGREFAAVGSLTKAATFIDISNPDSIFEVGSIAPDDKDNWSNMWRDLKYWNRHVYIGTEAPEGIKVVSVDNPDNPILVNTISDFTNSHNIHIDTDGYLYVIGAEGHGVWIYELTDHPENPLLVGTWDGDYFHDIEVYNNKLYGAAIYSGKFYILDVSNKSQPTTLLSHSTGSPMTHDCAVTYDENYLITADERGGGHINIWDISDYENINKVSEYKTHPQHSMHNVYIRPETNLVIMSYYVDGTRILDISDPSNPIEVGYYDTTTSTGLFDGNWGTYAYLPSGHIISSDREHGLFIFNSPLSDSTMVWSACLDCAGIENGGSYIDNCGECVSSDTGPNTYKDCLGECFGNAELDECGVCDGPGSIYSCGCSEYPYNWESQMQSCDCDGNIDIGCGCGEDDSCLLDLNKLEIPTQHGITNIYPNPFNPITQLFYNLSISSKVKISVYNSNGLELDIILNEFQNVGNYSIIWDASQYSTGLYLIRIELNNFSQIKKVLLIK